MLTLEDLKKVKPGAIIDAGHTLNNPSGTFMTQEHLNREMIWVAKKGHGYDDWTIYIGWSENGVDWVLKHGDKVMRDENIQKLVPCTDEVLKLYRH